MKTKSSKQVSLTKKEQTTTATFKLMSDKVKTLEASLRKTQDACEKFRSENHELDKKNILLEQKLKDSFLIQIIEFLCAAALGFSLNYIQNGQYGVAFSIGIPAVVIYFVCAYLTRK